MLSNKIVLRFLSNKTFIRILLFSKLRFCATNKMFIENNARYPILQICSFGNKKPRTKWSGLWYFANPCKGVHIGCKTSQNLCNLEIPALNKINKLRFSSKRRLRQYSSKTAWPTVIPLQYSIDSLPCIHYVYTSLAYVVFCAYSPVMSKQRWTLYNEGDDEYEAKKRFITFVLIFVFELGYPIRPLMCEDTLF